MYLMSYVSIEIGFVHHLRVTLQLQLQDTGEFTLELEKPLRYVPWCSVDPYPSAETKYSEMVKFPLYFQGPKPFECTVNPGEILYL